MLDNIVKAEILCHNLLLQLGIVALLQNGITGSSLGIIIVPQASICLFLDFWPPLCELLSILWHLPHQLEPGHALVSLGCDSITNLQNGCIVRVAITHFSHVLDERVHLFPSYQSQTSLGLGACSTGHMVLTVLTHSTRGCKKSLHNVRILLEILEQLLGITLLPHFEGSRLQQGKHPVHDCLLGVLPLSLILAANVN